LSDLVTRPMTPEYERGCEAMGWVKAERYCEACGLLPEWCECSKPCQRCGHVHLRGSLCAHPRAAKALDDDYGHLGDCTCGMKGLAP
jgi:hypothetical protein